MKRQKTILEYVQEARQINENSDCKVLIHYKATPNIGKVFLEQKIEKALNSAGLAYSNGYQIQDITVIN